MSKGYSGLSRIGGSKFDAPLNVAKAGAIFQSLPTAFQQNIANNLKISDTMKKDIESGRKYKMTDEWTTGLTGSRTKMKVTTDVSGKTITYTAKVGNKIINKTQSKESIANTVAKFYSDEMKKRKK